MQFQIKNYNAENLNYMESESQEFITFILSDDLW